MISSEEAARRFASYGWKISSTVWGPDGFVLYDGDTVFTRSFTLENALERLGDGVLHDYPWRVIVNRNLTAPVIDPAYTTGLLVAGNVYCDKLTDIGALTVNGDLHIRHLLRFFSEDHETILKPLTSVRGKTFVPYILTWHAEIPDLHYHAPEQTLALRTGDEDDAFPPMRMLYFNDLRRMLRPELFIVEDTVNYHDVSLREELLEEYIREGRSFLKDDAVF